MTSDRARFLVVVHGITALFLALPAARMQAQTVTAPSALNNGDVVVATGSSTVYTPTLAIDGSGDITGTSNSIAAGSFTAGTVTTSTTGAPTSNALGLVTILIQNSGNSSTATAANELACWDGSGAAKTCTMLASSGVIGLVYAAPVLVGTTNYSQIVRMGSFACKFDNTVAIGDYVVPSGTTAGDCDDAGATYPASKQPVGFVASSATGGIAYVFAMNDLPSQTGTFASLGEGNTWTAGTQSFSSATALITPVASGAAPTANGSVAYDITEGRYVLGGDNGTTLVPTTSPLGSLGTVTSSPDKVCANYTDSGCANSVNATSATQFQQTVKIPPGFFGAAFRTVRTTYHLVENSSTSPPAVTYYLVWNYNGSPTTIFSGTAAVPPASITGNQLTISCTVIGPGANGTMVKLYANCTSSALGTVSVSGYSLPILAIPQNATAYTSINAVNTTNLQPQSLGLAVSWAAGTSGNLATLLAVVPEFVQ